MQRKYSSGYRTNEGKALTRKKLSPSAGLLMAQFQPRRAAAAAAPLTAQFPAYLLVAPPQQI